MPGRMNVYSEQIRQISILTTVPIILLIGPAVGFYLGRWADRQWHTYPWFTIILVALGFAASARQVARLLKDVVGSGAPADKKTGK